MPPRLGYKKSRAGCLRCKQRRVKCDEKKPCSACIRHGVECSLVSISEASGGESTLDVNIPDAPPPPPPTSKVEIRPRRRVSSFRSVTSASTDDLPTPSRSERSHPSTPDPFPYFSEFAAAHSPQSDKTDNTIDAWLTDLELMHQYATLTCPTLPRAKELLDVWQIQVPKLALSYPFLLHQVLATAAFHLAYLNPDGCEKYFMNASHHQSEAINGLRISLTEITSENCHALFGTTTLLTLCAFATYADPKRSTVHATIDNIQYILILIRGLSLILGSHDNELYLGIFGYMLKPGQPTTSSILNALLGQLQQLDISENESLTAADAEICRQSVAATITWIQRSLASTQEPEIRICVSWPICVPEQLIELMRKRNPTALVLLAYYGVLLHFCSKKHWFMQGWGEKIIQDVHEPLDLHYRGVLEWCKTTMENITSFDAHRS